MRLESAGAARIRSSNGKQELVVPVLFKDRRATIVQEYIW
jgi:hypothetical protein